MTSSNSYDRTIVLIGQPNVGKSVLMNALTGVKAFVSNYPGTTVEVTKGEISYQGVRVRVIDTPGTYTLHSDTDEQKVAQHIIMTEPVDMLVNVVDATNLDRSLYLTLQLLDFELPMIVVLNQVDRARSLGLEIKVEKLQQILGVPVIPVAAIKGEGLPELKEAVIQGRAATGKPMAFSAGVEEVIRQLMEEIESNIPGEDRYQAHPLRTLAIHLLEHDAVDEELMEIYPGMEHLVENLQQKMGHQGHMCYQCFRGCSFCPVKDQDHPILLTCIERTARARQITQEVMVDNHRSQSTPMERVEGLLDAPITGIPLLLGVVYLSFKIVMLLVGGAEQVVTALMDPLGRWLGSMLLGLPDVFLPHVLAQAVPEGLILPLSIVLPAMVSVYLIMAILEDTGLLPRLAVTMDRAMGLLGLPGQSLIPLILGFGCRAPAVLATRILPERGQRFLVTVLLSIVIPCAASLGIIAGVVAKFQANIAVIVLSLAAVFLVLGVVLGRHLRENNLDLVLEVPPLRVPAFKNVASKTWMRLEGFFTHVLPLLLVMSIFIRVLLELKVFEVLGGLSPVTLFLFGIRGEAFVGTVITVVQRYLAPMVLLNLPLGPREATIATTMVSLSFPCLPVSALIIKEMGWKEFLKIMALGAMVPVAVGIILNLVLP